MYTLIQSIIISLCNWACLLSFEYKLTKNIINNKTSWGYLQKFDKKLYLKAFYKSITDMRIVYRKKRGNYARMRKVKKKEENMCE
jgi:hypothetical protein